MTPRIPKRMAGCPVHGGLAVPEVAARHRTDARPPLFGINHPVRVNTLLIGKGCGNCGQRLSTRPGGKYTVLLRPGDVTRGYTGEPALHSECARYAVEACPMLNGQMSGYRSTPRDLEAERCGDPQCDCVLWTNASPDRQARAGAPASPFWAAVYRQEDYRLHRGDKGRHGDVLLGIALRGVEWVSCRKVTSGDLNILDLSRALLMGLPLD
ncbi:hypothetical protein [Spongiactinospora sp. TRM90649]|uniref:hypothetical protein n=1 Tax=Spongiactinospora sp. TRM90649 TaxID=3031114 RepID=UPI0023FA26B0|nr:hypothetical protein [Spongiactinospora sp. TRM90649]MDF5756560.1 hypothetical protein [Spongiactinospora sp. TRM90649]